MRRHRQDYEFDREEPYVVIERRDSGIGPLLLGLALGAGAALLFAPRSGADTRRILKDRAREATDAARTRVDEFAASVSESIGEARSVVEERVDAVRSTVRQRREDLRDALDAGRSAAHEARVELERKLAARKMTDRQSSDRPQAMPLTPDDVA
jgi:gas vesicle protein